MKKFLINSCKECGGEDLQWQSVFRNNGQAQNGRLCLSEVSVEFFLGCNYCSETLAFATEQEILNVLDDIK